MDSLFFAPQTFDQAAPALAYVQQIYQAGLQQLRRALQDFLAGQDIAPVRACYPCCACAWAAAPASSARSRAWPTALWPAPACMKRL